MAPVAVARQAHHLPGRRRRRAAPSAPATQPLRVAADRARGERRGSLLRARTAPSPGTEGSSGLASGGSGFGCERARRPARARRRRAREGRREREASESAAWRGRLAGDVAAGRNASPPQPLAQCRASAGRAARRARRMRRADASRHRRRRRAASSRLPPVAARGAAVRAALARARFRPASAAGATRTEAEAGNSAKVATGCICASRNRLVRRESAGQRGVLVAILAAVGRGCRGAGARGARLVGRLRRRSRSSP